MKSIKISEHAKQRAKKRLGIDINSKDAAKITRDFTNNGHLGLMPSSSKNTVLMLAELKGSLVTLCIDPASNTLVTVFPALTKFPIIKNLLTNGIQENKII